MQVQDIQLKRCIEKIEAKLDWGSSEHWTHQDFLNLSDKILEETGEQLSYITLKRIWGKVTYNSLPNVQTLNILARFLGFDSWRAFGHCVDQENLDAQKGGKSQKSPDKEAPSYLFFIGISKRNWRLIRNLGGMAVLAMLILIIIQGASERPVLNPEDFYFSSTKVVSQGIPNSVIFDIDAHKSPYDSVDVQQSWNANLRTRIPKHQSQHTSMYYFPGFFEAKLVVGEEVVLEHSLHITTDGWYCAIQQEPVPVYFPVEKVLHDGKLVLERDQVLSKNVELQPNPPLTRMGISKDFDGLKTDNFIFEAKVKNTFKEGSSICQTTRVYLLCEGAAIWIPLMAKGCISSASLNFINHGVSGKKKDLSAFGVDFDDDVHLRIVCVDGKADIFLDDKLAYSIEEKIRPVSIKGIDFRFLGLGAIDDVRLGRPNGEWVFEDYFETHSR